MILDVAKLDDMPARTLAGADAHEMGRRPARLAACRTRAGQS